ncbi:uncharacterized protein LOC125659779 [Ostrea edulis]|uniref:uncharacterized protein LOC125659779 n=1 Tax=Ostrea edulis TaxID=37623 RepID=UPI0024AFAE44|nr:uncharacterized protein LOC125659779 [Ostrea edulis]
MRFLLVFIVVFTLLVHSEAWWWGKRGNNRGCPSRTGAAPYYFGTTNLSCLSKQKGKRGAPWRGTWSYTHRFIYYRGKYLDLLGNSRVAISSRRFGGHRCSGGREGSPAGYSEVSLACIEGCARNYRCTFGRYRLLWNNCHHFANKISQVLCRMGNSCPRWCQRKTCNYAYYSGQ